MARTTLLDTPRRCVADALVHVLDGVFDGGAGIFLGERGCGKARGDWGTGGAVVAVVGRKDRVF